MRRTVDIVLTAAVVALLSCGGGGGHAPVARFSMTPKYVCGGDKHITVVAMDATLSSDPVDDPPEKALACATDADCAKGRACRDTGAPPDPVTGKAQMLCLIPLQYFWEVEDESFVKTDGDFGGVKLAGTFAGDRPSRVTLTVTDSEGGTNSVSAMLGITSVFAATCAADLDCPQGYLCDDPLGTGKGCYLNCETDEGICNYCPDETKPCAKCYLCKDRGDRKLCLPASQ